MAIRTFAIFKNDNATGNQPQYRMVGKDENAPKEEKSADLAGLWIKEYQGKKFYSGKLNQEFKKDDGSVKPGYIIISEDEYNRLKNGAEVENEANQTAEDDEIPF